MVKINITNIGKIIEIEAGKTLGEIAAELKIKLKYSILGAIVNNKTMGLTYRIYQPKRITFFDITHPEGLRTYTRSLRFMLYAALKDTLPHAKLEIRHSVSRGLYCEVFQNGIASISNVEIEKVRDRMRQLTKLALPIIRQELETSQVLDMIKEHDEQRRLLEGHGDIYTTIHTLEQHNAVLYGDLVPNTGIIDVYDLTPYHNGMLLSLPETSNPEQVAQITKQDKMFSVFIEFDQWLKALKIQNLADLNEAISNGQGNKVLQVAEALHEKKIAAIADQIANRPNVKFIMIAGPSSSGKTTFSKRLALQLIVNGITPVNLSIDDYFVNRELTPRDANGDYDFEAVEAIDVKLFNQQLTQLLNGEEVEIPKFNFKTGSRYYDGTKLQMHEGDVLVIEGTHALTPQLTYLVPKESKFGIYICPMASINMDGISRIHTTDNRLIRRMVRDYKTRGYSASDTIARWPSVRHGEDVHIYPNQEFADVMFNTALCYELSVLKAQAEPILLEVARNSEQYAEARRLLRMLSYVKSLKPENIPPTSILREFLGGSSFEY
ncbi:MAG: nucleoside kinase [Marinilabiliaceae bacterium]|nr:nucleoside kinase [Marinilabiliaceae bacterium]